MALATYQGPANTPEVFEALTGDTIVGVFVCEGDYGRERWLVVASGHAVVMNLKTGAYWRADVRDVWAKIDQHRGKLQRVAAELHRLGTIDLATNEPGGER